ncbi:arrestin domain-containing protein 17-like [Sitodiplosis mosellana]|uniref:arrestin domain-containing protein 17-like n=1 Tax=Sitodiplosis mosellana TaxID=263140 RepID=UPI002443DA6D|nr:arrestin domain-containing protein 17-like [Sitodiplosis mosellana]
MSATCVIEFEDNPRKIIYAGQLLRGMVRLNLTENTNVRSVYVRIKGKAFASWKSGKTKVEAKEKYLDEKMYLVGSYVAGEISLEAGMHEYAFEFIMPSSVPSSIDGKIGHIKYTVRVVLDVPLWMSKVFKEEFTLIKALNLNDQQSLRQPLTVEEISGVLPFCLQCFDRNRIYILARAPVSGFLPRQTVNLEINVQNRSSVAISHFTIELIQLITYLKDYDCCGYKSNYKKQEEKSLFTGTSDGCNEVEYKTIHIAAEIPPTPPTEILMSKVVKVTYLIRVKACTPLLYKNVILNLPITIGSYPFQDNVMS